MNIRVKDIDVRGSDVTVKYEYTTYFDSLVTNRAMDYPLGKKHSIREIYEPGPFLNSLPESRLSNHLGFNGFVELNDGTIIFVFRSDKVSIGKSTWAQSIGASLKTMYCINQKTKQFDREGLGNAIKNEIKDELKIEINEDIDFTKSVFAFYRDIVEGGKPQFLFYYKCSFMGREQFEKNFKEKTADSEAKKENRKKMITDGDKFKFFTLEQLKGFKYTSSAMIIGNNEKLPMTPSSVASVMLFLKAMEDKV